MSQGKVMNSARCIGIIRIGIFLAGALVIGTPAYATFPGVDISLWDPHLAKKDRTNPEYLHIQGLAEEKKFSEALVAAEKLIGKRPKLGTPKILKALILYELGRYRAAWSVLQEARAIQPRHPAVHYANCQIYRHLGAVDLTDRSCEIAVQQHPNRPEAHYEKALTLAALGRMKKANQELTAAAALDPENAVYPFHRGMNLTYLNLPAEAIEAFKKAVALDPDDLESIYQMGFIYATQNNLEAAEQQLNRVYDTRRDHPKVEAARALLEFLKTKGPSQLPSEVNPAQFHFSRSKALYRDRDLGLALLEIQTAARLAPENKEIHHVLIGLASMLLRIQLAEKAVHQYMKIVGDAPQLKAKTYQELGDLKVMRGDIEGARKLYREAIRLGDPDDIGKISLGELPLPDSSIEPAPPPPPWIIQPSEGLNRKGEVFAHFGMYKRAVAVYSLALRMDPANLTAKLNTAAAYYHSNQFNRAIGLLEKILVSHPNHSNLFAHRVLLARAYARKGDDQGALTNLQMARRMKPDLVRSLKQDPAFAALRENPVFD